MASILIKKTTSKSKGRKKLIFILKEKRVQFNAKLMKTLYGIVFRL